MLVFISTSIQEIDRAYYSFIYSDKLCFLTHSVTLSCRFFFFFQLHYLYIDVIGKMVLCDTWDNFWNLWRVWNGNVYLFTYSFFALLVTSNKKLKTQSQKHKYFYSVIKKKKKKKSRALWHGLHSHFDFL